MLIVNAISGNIYENAEMAKKFQEVKQHGTFRRLLLSRIEMEKSRLRKKTEDGFDIGLVLEPGKRLRHGDIILESSETILIEQLPEKILTVKFKDNNPELLLLVGHIIGNRHRPISINNETISFPIHDDSEMELFQRLFHEVIDKIDLTVDKQRFIPHVGMDIHEH